MKKNVTELFQRTYLLKACVCVLMIFSRSPHNHSTTQTRCHGQTYLLHLWEAWPSFYMVWVK